MQTAFVDVLHPQEQEILLAEHERVIAAYAEMRVPVVAVTMALSRANESLHTRIRIALAAARRLTKVYVISKMGMSAFGSDEFTERLDLMGRNSLVITGMYADACVYHTAVDAVKKKYRVVTTPDLIAPGNVLDPYPDRIAKHKAAWFQKHCIVLQTAPTF